MIKLQGGLGARGGSEGDFTFEIGNFKGDPGDGDGWGKAESGKAETERTKLQAPGLEGEFQISDFRFEWGGGEAGWLGHFQQF